MVLKVRADFDQQEEAEGASEAPAVMRGKHVLPGVIDMHEAFERWDLERRRSAGGLGPVNIPPFEEWIQDPPPRLY